MFARFIARSSFVLAAPEEGLRAPWRNVDIKSRGVYSECANCGHFKTRYHQKAKIESDNNKSNRAFKAAMKAHDEKIARGETANAPARSIQSLQVACACGVIGFSHFVGVSCDICSDGSCSVCTCPCTCVCKMSNFTTVKAARLAKDNDAPNLQKWTTPGSS